MKLARLVVAILAISGVALAQQMPKPQIRLIGVTDIINNGYAMKMYEVEVVNRQEISDEFFQLSPALPRCGRNPNASRTWINIYGDKGAAIYGWCAIATSAELGSLKFLMAETAPQPKRIFIDLVDRAEDRVIRSNKIAIKKLN